MTYQCSDIQRVVWADGPDAAPSSHLDECKTCSSEARRAGDLLAALSGMGVRLAVAPDALEQTLIHSVARTRVDRVRDIVSHPKFWRGAAVGAAAAATAAVGLIVARRATRPEVA